MSRAKAKRLGLLAPVAAPEFELVRKPLWVKNNTAAGPWTIYEKDPMPASSGLQDVLYHYETFGSNYVRHPWHSNMAWDAADDYFAFKCFIKPHSIHGRVLLLSNKSGLLSGGLFVDMLDGRVRVGWYDSVQKREVWIGTDVPVVRPDVWHIIYVRKRFPETSLGSGCWQDSIFNRNTGTACDVLFVREITNSENAGNLEPEEGFWPGSPTWTTKPFNDTALFGVNARDSVGFTSDLEYSVAGCSATGLVSRSNTTYTGAVAGVVTATVRVTDGAQVALTPNCLHHNMLWQWSTANGGPHDGKLFVVVNGTRGGLSLSVIDPDTGLAPDFSAYGAGSTGGIFTGVRLVKSEGFSTATNPDISSRDFELFGSHLAENPETGIQPYSGKFSSWALQVASGAGGADPNLFEPGAGVGDDMLIGTDATSNIAGYTDADNWGELHATTGNVQSCVDTQPYAGAAETSSVPNEKLEIDQDGESSSTSTDPRWANVGRVEPVRGRYECAIAFYDPEQVDILPYSAPGPRRIIKLPGEDKSNPSAFVGLRFYNLPVSRDRGEIQRWLFLSEVDSGELFLAAIVPDNVSTDVVVTGPDELRPRGDVLSTDNTAPPACRYVATTQGVMAFCSVAGQPDLIVWSKPFFVGAVPRARNIFQVPSGATAEITGVADFNGRLLVFKRDSVYRALLRDGVAIYDRLTGEFGCVGHGSIVTLQNRIYWVGEQGLCIYEGAGLPDWVSRKLETFFNDGLDQESAQRMSAAINRRRNQLVLSLREADEFYQSHRISAEMSPLAEIAHRFGRFDDPGLTALASLRDKGGQVSRLVGGTDDGFGVWLDRADTALVLLGPTAAYWGDSALVASTGSTSTRITLQGTPNVDLELAGPRGAKLRWTVAGTVVEALVLLAEANALHLDRPLANANIPVDGTALTLGLRTRYWKTKWLDLGVPEARKRMRHLDVVFTKQASGTVTVTAFEDFGTTAESVGTINLTGPGWARMAIDKIQARFVQFAFESSSTFELTEIILRASDADTR